MHGHNNNPFILQGLGNTGQANHQPHGIDYREARTVRSQDPCLFEQIGLEDAGF